MIQRHQYSCLRSNWQVNLYGIFRVQNCPPPKICGPVRPNTSNMPKAGPGPSYNFLCCWAIEVGDKWWHNDVNVETVKNIDQNSRSQTAVESIWSVSELSTDNIGSRRELVANSVHTADADATQLDSWVALELAVCIGHNVAPNSTCSSKKAVCPVTPFCRPCGSATAVRPEIESHCKLSLRLWQINVLLSITDLTLATSHICPRKPATVMTILKRLGLYS